MAAIVPVRLDAEVAAVSLEDMNSSAMFVGLVNETSVSQISRVFQFMADQFPRFPLFWGKTAYASVKEVWKGPTYKQISYRASPSWACDVSRAAAGADAVVFLDKVFISSLEIAWAGHGRYPLLKEGSETCINIGDAVLPPELNSKIKSVSRYEKLLVLDDLRAWCCSRK